MHSPGDSSASSVPTPDEVLAELERIFGSPQFEASDRRRVLLKYLVEETLAGRADRLKGYTIAVAVFERDETFDAQADPVVRLEARRLRRDLDSYYVDAGSLDPVRISIPKGAYAAFFERREVIDVSPSNPERTSPAGLSRVTGAFFPLSRRARVMGLLALLTVTAVVVATVTLATRTDDEPVGAGAGGGPIVVVLPFQSLGSSADSQYLATGISQELILNLMRFPSFRLYTLPTGPEESSGYVATRQEQESGATYAVIGSVQMNADEIYVTAQLQLAATGLVLWSESFHRPPNPEALIEVQRDLAGKIASKIGSPYGAVNKDLERWLKTPTVSSMQSYICVLRAYRYRRSFSQEAYDPVLECLNETVRRDPYYSDAWAMLGWLHLDAGRFEFAGAGNLQKEYEEAFNAASRAVSLQPENTLAIKALASVNHYMGRYDEAERLSRRAVQLNPYDPDALAQLGWRLAVRGNFEEGIPILNKAIERTVNPPGWYFLLIAIDLYLKGDYPQMLQVAERSIEGGTALGQAMLAIASGALGNAELARTALKRMSEFPPLARDPASYFRRNGATDEITDALVTGLAIAQQVANEQPYRQ